MHSKHKHSHTHVMLECSVRQPILSVCHFCDSRLCHCSSLLIPKQQELLFWFTLADFRFCGIPSHWAHWVESISFHSSVCVRLRVRRKNHFRGMKTVVRLRQVRLSLCTLYLSSFTAYRKLSMLGSKCFLFSVEVVHCVCLSGSSCC